MRFWSSNNISFDRSSNVFRCVVGFSVTPRGRCNNGKGGGGSSSCSSSAALGVDAEVLVLLFLLHIAAFWRVECNVRREEEVQAAQVAMPRRGQEESIVRPTARSRLGVRSRPPERATRALEPSSTTVWNYLRYIALRSLSFGTVYAFYRSKMHIAASGCSACVTPSP